MSSRTERMRDLKELRVKLVAQMDAIKNQIVGLDLAIQTMSGQPPSDDVPTVSDAKVRRRRGNVKDTVLDLMTDAAETGLSAIQCVEVAKSKLGIDLDRGSVSSLLSRLKKDDVLFYDGERYRLKQYAGPRSAA